MPYTALPDRRIPYDNDGTVVGYNWTGAANGIAAWLTTTDLQNLQDNSYGVLGNATISEVCYWWFFPEQREVTAFHIIWKRFNGTLSPTGGPTWEGSNDTTNGVDGTWETASLPSGAPMWANVYSWRADIKPISFTGGKRTVRVRANGTTGNNDVQINGIAHLYGEKVAGQTPDDLIYIDHDTTPGIEYTAPEDFGDQPLGTTVVRQFRLKNTSATKTANAINVQCNDSDFAISTDGVTWVVTISIASLGPGAQSATMYVRCTTPAPGNLLGPRFGRIVTTVASYT